MLEENINGKNLTEDNQIPNYLVLTQIRNRSAVMICKSGDGLGRDEPTRLDGWKQMGSRKNSSVGMQLGFIFLVSQE